MEGGRVRERTRKSVFFGLVLQERARKKARATQLEQHSLCLHFVFVYPLYITQLEQHSQSNTARATQLEQHS
jgi:hypothetical protein